MSNMLGNTGLALLFLVGASFAGATEVSVSNDEEVLSAIADAAPGDTLTLKAGFYRGDWKLKAGAAGKPITLRAERPGRVIVSSLEVIGGFKPVAGSDYSWSRPFAFPLTKLRELDTGTELRWMTTTTDVEEVVGSFCYDERAARLYVHPSDSAGTEHHLYGIIADKPGITLANHTVVDSLVLAGFGGEGAIIGRGVDDVRILNCKLYRNGYGICLTHSRNCVVKNNEAWENRPDYSEGSQVFFTGDCQDILVEANNVHDSLLSRNTGIFFYSGQMKNCVTRGNLMWNTGANFFKCNSENNLTERNVCIRSLLGGGSSCPMHYNTFSSPMGTATSDPQTDLDIGKTKADSKFVDPAWQDYRLQSDSPVRGQGKNGTDLGACPYQGEVFFVKPDGNDQAEGTSLAAAWKTLDRAARALQPGQTLYVHPGRYDEPLCLAGKPPAAGKRLVLRVRGKGKAWVQGVHISNCKDLELAHFFVTGQPADGFRIVHSENVTLLNCASYVNKGHGVSVSGCKGISLQHCALWKNAESGLYAGKSSDLELTSSLVLENKRQVFLNTDVSGYFSAFNALNAASVGQTARLADPAKGDFRVPSGTLAAWVGLYDSPVGPDGVVVQGKIDRKPIERIETLSVTRTSANLRWFTPGRMCGTILEWGPTEKYGNSYDRGDGGTGEYVFVHTVSLINLKPDTVYHYRVGYRNFWASEAERSGGTWPTIWSGDHTFRTAKEDPVPRQLYVAPDGDDTRDGLTRQTAWQSLPKASREARAGDTVNIAPGRYLGLLCPLQTGASQQLRITFRGERPLSVLVDGGANNEFRGRPHAVQLQGKAFVTIENVTATNFGRNTMDYGGYRGGHGYAGVFRMSGGAMNEFKGCVADSRNITVGFVFFDAGLMPDARNTEHVYGAHLSDSATVGSWRCRRLRTPSPLVGSQHLLCLRRRHVQHLGRNREMGFPRLYLPGHRFRQTSRSERFLPRRRHSRPS